MLRIEVTTNVADARRAWEAGRSYDVSEETADKMIAAGHARPAASPVSEVVRLLGEMGGGLLETAATDPVLAEAARQAGIPVKTDRRVGPRGASDGN